MTDLADEGFRRAPVYSLKPIQGDDGRPQGAKIVDENNNNLILDLDRRNCLRWARLLIEYADSYDFDLAKAAADGKIRFIPLEGAA